MVTSVLSHEPIYRPRSFHRVLIGERKVGGRRLEGEVPKPRRIDESVIERGGIERQVVVEQRHSNGIIIIIVFVEHDDQQLLVQYRVQFRHNDHHDHVDEKPLRFARDREKRQQRAEQRREQQQRRQPRADHQLVDERASDRHDVRAAWPPSAKETHEASRDLALPGSRRTIDRDVGARLESLSLRLDIRGRLPMHRVRETRHPEDVQKQIQLPTARVPLPRGPSEKGVPVPRVRQGVLQAGQDEESHEDGARLFHAQGLRGSVRLFSLALAGGARARWGGDRSVGTRGDEGGPGRRGTAAGDRGYDYERIIGFER